MQKLAIYGAGGFGRGILPAVQEYAQAREDAGVADFSVVFVDDHEAAPAILGAPVVRFGDLSEGDSYILAIGNGMVRKALAERCDAAGLIEASVFARGAIQGLDVSIGPGAVFCDNTTVTASVRIGRQFQCNLYSYVEHDCVIGDFVTFAPRVSCNGNVHIGDGAYIGSGAVIRNGCAKKPIRIGAGAIVGMGAVVTKDVPPGVTVVGNPARAHS